MADLDPAAAREDARRVLEDDRYQARDVPRPLRGVLRWVGERVEDVADPVGDVLSTPAGLAATTVLVVAVTAVAVATAVRRRNRSTERGEARARRAQRADPAALEREAERAEAAGDLDAAVRLRFRAGVARLEEAEVIPRRADATTRQLVVEVPSPSLAPLAATFDEVAYGGRPAGALDLEAARQGWPRVLDEAHAAQRAGEGR